MAKRRKEKDRSSGSGEVKIPDKLYFKIGEASKIVGVEPYVLRFWEREFPMLKPAKTKTNQRLYRRQDIELILEIKRLLHDEKFTIEGARRYLSDRARRKAQPQQLTLNLEEQELRTALLTVRDELEKIKSLLKSMEF